jgi:hypothetical protein
VPLDILKKSPKLHAAYESRLPELPAIPEDVGHVLVHYLHTGTYGSLKPKPTDTMSKQICELKTSIQAYAAARAYELPDLMRLAEAKIDKYGEGLPLPALLEVARDAYPTLTEGDDWFLEYLRSRIRPHLKDPKSLLGSNLLDQISSILSPNRVLLRTVLELFCERIVVRLESVTSPTASTIASPITSPGSSRSASPLPPASPRSLLEMRSRSLLGDEFTPARKPVKATPWPSPDNMSEASWARSMSPERVLPETAPPQFEAKPMPEPVSVPSPFVDLGPVILDVVPPPGPSIETRAVVEPEIKPAPEPEIKIAIEPETKVEAEPETKVENEPEIKLAAEPVAPATEAPVETETAATEEPDVKQEIEATPVPAAITRRERKDSGKGIDLEPLPKELETIPELIPELESEFIPQPQTHRPVLREADSGFWEAPDVESGKEPAPSLVELEPVVVSIPESAQEPQPVTNSKDVLGVDTRDFACSETQVESKTDKQTETDPEVAKELILVPPPAEDSASDTAADVLPTHAPEPKPELEPLPIHSVEEVPERLAGAAALVVPEITPVEEHPEETQSKEVEAQPETEKVEPLPRCSEQESLLTIRQVQQETVEPKAVAKPEPEPTEDPSDPVHLSDAAQPAGSVEPKTAQPGVEPGPKPAGKAEVQRANTDSALHSAGRLVDSAKSPAVLGSKPAAEQEGAKTETDAAGIQPCSTQVRQRGWKKRFLSLRYPVLFGRGM